jgi:hypothetical protein
MRSTPFLFAVAMGAVACASSEEPPIVAERASLADRLAAGEELWFNPYASWARVNVRSGGEKEGTIQEDMILIKRGTAKVMRDAAGDPALYSLELELEDMVVGSRTTPVQLTNLRFTLVNPVDGPGCWNMEATDVEVRTTMALDFAWSMTGSGNWWILSTQRVHNVPVVVTAFIDDGTVRAHVSVARPGVFWSDPRGIELMDLRLELEAVDYVFEPIP